ncbi:MAG: response regulator [Myxococcales bacterium]|nr:response regulator [Myxococcales bacterium]
MNLLSNAIKFSSRTDRVGAVWLHAAQAGEDAERVWLELSVRDNGIGIAAAAQGRIFRAFEQADTDTAARFGGTGLGLAISKELATLMGGELRVVSELGRGSTFTLRVPLARVAQPAEVATQPPPAPRGRAPLAASKPVHAVADDAVVSTTREEQLRQGRLLLVAEDNATNRETLRLQLGQLGYAMDFAENGALALESWRRTPGYGALLTDLQMPVMGGYELAAAIRREEKASGRRRLPILAVSANYGGGELERARTAEIDDHLNKPLRLATLEAGLARWVPAANAKPHADSEAAMPAAPVDLSLLAEAVQDDQRALANLVQLFRKESKAVAQKLAAAVSARELPDVHQFAHQLKGMAAQLGASALHECCTALEASDADGAKPEFDQRLAQLTAELKLVDAYLESHPTGRPPTNG